MQLAETCQLAVQRIEWLNASDEERRSLPKSPYMSVDPAPPSQEMDVGKLQAILLDERQSLFDRYRAMFSLRNIGSKEAVLALGKGIN